MISIVTLSDFSGKMKDDKAQNNNRNDVYKLQCKGEF